MKYCLHCVCKIEDPNGRYCPECGKEHSVSYPQSYELPPETYLNNGRYFVGESIGVGGYGITYIGFDIKLDKKIVIKETFYSSVFKRNCNDKTRKDPLRVEYNENVISPEKILKKSQKECSYLAKAESLSNIVKVYDWFSENNTAYIITEYIDGVTLFDRIYETGRYSWKELYSYMKPLIESLAQLHKNDVLHRDVTPRNIMLRKTYSGKEEFILIDFGLAKSNQAITVGTVHVGYSPGYAPIEQQRLGEEDGTYTDVYAMAATIYHALSGEQPNGDPGLYTTSDIFPKLNSLRSYDDIPNYVVDTLEYALQIDFHHRCQTLDEFLLRLENKPVASKTDPKSESRPTPEKSVKNDNKPNRPKIYQGETIAAYPKDEEPEQAINPDRQRVTDLSETKSEYYGDVFNQREQDSEEIPISKKKGTAALITVAASLVLIVGLIAVLNITGSVNVSGIVKPEENSEQEYVQTSVESKKVTTDTEKYESVSGVQNVSSVEYVNIPNVEGLSRESAQKLIESAGLKYDIDEEENDSTDDDRILRQYPTAGTEIESGETVQLVVTKEKPKEVETNTEKEESQAVSSVQSKAEDTTVTVPNVKNLSYEEAVNKLTELGLIADLQDYQYSNEVENNYVISQSPESGKVKKNTKISLVVSKGSDPQFITVGNYIGQNIDNVKSELESQGIHVLYKFIDSGYSYKSVTYQSVVAGTSISKNDSITFEVAQPSVSYTMVGDFFGGLDFSNQMGGFPAGNILQFDGEAWAPDASGGINEYIMFHSPKKNEPMTVSGCIIDIGCGRTNEDFFAYGRPTDIKVEFSDGSSCNISVDPNDMLHQVRYFDKKHTTTSLKFIIEKSNSGTDMNNPCIDCIVPIL